jgi:hypothetical protein
MPCAAILGNCLHGCDCGYCLYGEKVPKDYVPIKPCELCLLRRKWLEEEEKRYQLGACDCETVYDEDGPYVKWLCDFCERRKEEAAEEN